MILHFLIYEIGITKYDFKGKGCHIIKIKKQAYLTDCFILTNLILILISNVFNSNPKTKCF